LMPRFFHSRVLTPSFQQTSIEYFRTPLHIHHVSRFLYLQLKHATNYQLLVGLWLFISNQRVGCNQDCHYVNDRSGLNHATFSCTHKCSTHLYSSLILCQTSCAKEDFPV
jgi:hypothetical protein